MAMHAAAASVGGKVVILPEHFTPPKITEIEILKMMPPLPPINWPERESKRERTHPNEPFYRKIKKRRREW